MAIVHENGSQNQMCGTPPSSLALTQSFSICKVDQQSLPALPPNHTSNLLSALHFLHWCISARLLATFYLFWTYSFQRKMKHFIGRRTRNSSCQESTPSTEGPLPALHPFTSVSGTVCVSWGLVTDGWVHPWEFRTSISCPRYYLDLSFTSHNIWFQVLA